MTSSTVTLPNTNFNKPLKFAESKQDDDMNYQEVSCINIL